MFLISMSLRFLTRSLRKVRSNWTRTIREAELLAAICAETGCEEADVERFLPEIERIEVWMGSVTVKRIAAPATPQSVQGKFTA